MRYTILILVIIPLLLCTGCDDATDDALAAEVAALRVDLEELQNTVAEQETTIAEQETTISGLQTRLETVEGYGDHGEGGYLTSVEFEATAAHGIAAADLDAWDGAVAELEGTSDGIIDSRVDLLEADLDLAEADIDSLRTDLDLAEADVGSLQIDVDLVETDIDTLEAGTLGRISSDLTLAVPADYADINEALDWLDGHSIDGGVTVEILVAGGTHTHTSEVEVRHPAGDRIEIRGSGVASTFLEFADSDGIVLTGASALGYLGELTLQATSGDGAGILVTDGSALQALGPVDVIGWGGPGIHVTRSASLAVEEGAVVLLDDCHTGASIDGGAFADLSGVSATGSAAHGFEAIGGQLLAAGAQATDNASRGFVASVGGLIWADGATATENYGGFEAWTGSTLIADNAWAIESTTGSGFLAREGSVLHAAGSTAQGSHDDNFSAITGSLLYAQGSFAYGSDDRGFKSLHGSTLFAHDSTASGNATFAYATGYNGYIYAASVQDDNNTYSMGNVDAANAFVYISGP